MNIQQLNNELGNIDIYLLDQILKGKISADSKILDAGCGEGRNLVYFLNNSFSVYGLDKNADAIRMLHFILGSKYPQCPKSNFHVGGLESMPYEDETFQYLICSAVLHFADNEAHFWQMLTELMRVTAKNGTLFIRMAADMGLSDLKPLGNGRFHLPDGSVRFLLTKAMVEQMKTQFNLSLIEPLKTVLVDDMRSMSTLVVQKN